MQLAESVRLRPLPLALAGIVLAVIAVLTIIQAMTCHHHGRRHHEEREVAAWRTAGTCQNGHWVEASKP